jgi:hypothetical protein
LGRKVPAQHNMEILLIKNKLRWIWKTESKRESISANYAPPAGNICRSINYPNHDIIHKHVKDLEIDNNPRISYFKFQEKIKTRVSHLQIQVLNWHFQIMIMRFNPLLFLGIHESTKCILIWLTRNSIYFTDDLKAIRQQNRMDSNKLINL